MDIKEIGNSLKITPSEGMYLKAGDMVMKVLHAPMGADLSMLEEVPQEEGETLIAEYKTKKEAEREAERAECEARIASLRAERQAK